MAEVSALYLRDGYSGKGHGLTGWYRDITVGEAKALNGYETLYATDRSGNVREIRLNGKPRVWKRSPGCVLSLKYGLKEYFHAGDKERQPHEPLSAYSPRIVVPVRGMEFAPETPANIVTDYVREQLGR